MIAEVVVVGAGIIGAAISYELARHGVDGVVVVEKAPGPAAGSTGASSSICRCRYTHPEVIRVARSGLAAFQNWAEYTRLPAPLARFQRTGAVWMFGWTADQVVADTARLLDQGVAATAIDAATLADRFPALSPCAVPLDVRTDTDHACVAGEAFMVEEEAGYMEPSSTNQDLLDAASRAGVDVRFSSRVVGVARSEGAARGVVLADGTDIAAGLVINASGPWCNQLNDLAGVELRWTLTPTRIQTLYREWDESLGDLPITLDGTSGIYLRPDLGRRVLIGSVLASDEEEVVDDPDDFRQTPDPDFRDEKMAAFHHRVPQLDPRGSVPGIAGLYTINREDVHPVLGPTELDRFWVANGFSGHGFKLAPAIGSMIAVAYTGTVREFDTDVPAAFFGVDRRPLLVATKHVLA
ncbi:MAG: NAD(P)/FAD-dependent oxidoreductase [Actinomycetota bacterium]